MGELKDTVLKEMIGDIAPKLLEITDEVILGDIWKRDELSPRDRSLITISSLITMKNTDQLRVHLDMGKENGLSEAELIEVITHLAFYVGWPKALAAIKVAKDLFSKDTP